MIRGAIIFAMTSLTLAILALSYVIDFAPRARPVATAPAATPFPGRTRPLCPYPAYAHYLGSGDIESAGSFVCKSDTASDHGEGDDDDRDHDGDRMERDR